MPGLLGDSHSRMVMPRRLMRMDLAKGGGGREMGISIGDKKKH